MNVPGAGQMAGRIDHNAGMGTPDSQRPGTRRQAGLGRSFAAHYIGMILAMASTVAFMIGARPSPTRTTGEDRPAIANSVGLGLGALSVSSFVVGSALDRRARQAADQQIEARVNSRADTGA